MGEDQTTRYTPRERVVAAYKGGFADRVPAYPIAGSFAGCLDGLSIEEYCTNPTKATKAMLNYYERYEPDIMIAFNDLAKEAEAIGCHVKYSDYVLPSIDRHFPSAQCTLFTTSAWECSCGSPARLVRWSNTAAVNPSVLTWVTPFRPVREYDACASR